MWYSVLRSEMAVPNKDGIKTVRAGSIYAVKKYTETEILCIPAEGISALDAGRVVISAAKARTFFTKPTRSLSDAFEESIMQCEANYC